MTKKVSQKSITKNDNYKSKKHNSISGEYGTCQIAAIGRQTTKWTSCFLQHFPYLYRTIMYNYFEKRGHVTSGAITYQLSTKKKKREM